jgi:uncharacterized membrane protein YjfL (UPF0719 family)
MPDPATDATTGASAPLLIRTVWGLALLATVTGVGRHDADALLAALPADGGWQIIPATAWLWAALHGAAAIATLACGYLVISLAYPRRHLAREAIDNPAAAIQACAHLLGAAAIAAVSWGGADAASLGISAVFCALGWLALVAICAGHRAVTRYHDHEEVADGNVAAALASAGLHLGVALVVGHAIQGQFTGWRDSVTGFVLTLVWVLALYPLRQMLLARIILRLTPADLDRRIAQHRDVWLGAAEGLFYVLAALCLAAGW